MAGRVPALALNDNVWLVLPFENTARAADAELIRQASVSQLYGEMSRWQGVRVISDDRVADLLQQVPEAQRERLGLETARNLARRVGAGRVVLGGYLAAGGRANLTAKVYETRTGRELRRVQDRLSEIQSAAALDSLTATFGRLARGILDVPDAGGGPVSSVGTSSMDAYRAYVAGMDAMNRVDLAGAQSRLQEAVRLDSNFALAHLQLRRVSSHADSSRVHLEAALRLASTLPPRSKAIVEAWGALQRGDRAELCTKSNQLVEADSAESEGWVLLSLCHRDPVIVVEDGRARLRGDMNRSLRAAERAYQLAPANLTTAQSLNQVLSFTSTTQCVPPAAGLCPADRSWRASFLPAGDSFAIVIGKWADIRHALPDLTPAAVEGRLARVRRMMGVVERIAATNPTSWILNTNAAQVALALGELAAAEARFGRVRTPTTMDTISASFNNYLQARFELALAQERPAVFQVYADSLFARAGVLTQYWSLLGRFGEGSDTTPALRENAAWRPILAGVIPPGLDSLERQMAARFTGPQQEDFLQLTTLAGFHMRRTGPALDTAARHPLKRFQAFFAAGNLVKARAALAEHDRELTARHQHSPDDGGWLFSAESHLELGDTATAFLRMQEFGRRWATEIQGSVILEMRYFLSTTPRLWGRAWLLYGDLAMARGARADARRAYRMVVGLWEHGDPIVQPMVTRARAALAQLGN